MSAPPAGPAPGALPAFPPHLLDETMGATFIGTILASIMYGLTCLQTWQYFVKYSKDPWYLKWLVAITFVTDSAQQALITAGLYTSVITNFGNPTIITALLKTTTSELFFTGFTALLVKAFFTFRIWRLSEHNVLITLLVGILSLAEFVAIMGEAVTAIIRTSILQLGHLKWVSILASVFGVASDIVIAAALCYLLQRQRNSMFRHSSIIINRLMVFAVNTGVLTSVCGVANLVAFLTMPKSFWGVGIFHLLGRMYVNSLLATLNARESIRQSAFEDVAFQQSLSQTRSTNVIRSRAVTDPEITVKIERQVMQSPSRGTYGVRSFLSSEDIEMALARSDPAKIQFGESESLAL